MPLNKESVCAEINKLSAPTIMGEEGKLYRIAIDRRLYYAKKWYALNRHNALGLERDPAVGFSLISPYWHVLQLNEQALIHAAFPENTLEMPLAFDDRIIDETSERPQFSTLSKGYPHTVTIEVAGDP